MAELLLSLGLLGTVSLVFREAYRPSWLRVAHGAAYAFLLWAAHPVLLDTSKKTLDLYLASPSAQNNILLLLTLDLALHAASLSNGLRRHRLGEGGARPAWDLSERVLRGASRVAYYTPPLWPAASLVYLRLGLLYAWPGLSFVGGTVAVIIATLALCYLAPLPLRFLRAWPEISYAPMAAAILAFLLAQLFAPGALSYAPSLERSGLEQVINALLFLAALIPIITLAYWLRLRQRYKL